MNGDEIREIVPPDGLRPAQLGVVFVGRVILGHLAATIADLAERGYLELVEVPGGDRPDWRLIDQRIGVRRPGLLPYEATLADGLFNRLPLTLLSDRAPDLAPVLDHVRSLITSDARRNGWLRRWPHRDRRTRRGEQLLARIQTFRRELRAALEDHGHDGLGDVGPYAMIFGLAGQSALVGDHLAASEQDPAVNQRAQAVGEPAVPFATFAATWQVSFAGCTVRWRDLPGPDLSRWRYLYAQQWSAPRGRWHGSHAHSQSHDYGGDYGGGYGSHGGGHAGGGGHGGH